MFERDSATAKLPSHTLLLSLSLYLHAVYADVECRHAHARSWLTAVMYVVST